MGALYGIISIVIYKFIYDMLKDKSPLVRNVCSLIGVVISVAVTAYLVEYLKPFSSMSKTELSQIIDKTPELKFLIESDPDLERELVTLIKQASKTDPEVNLVLGRNFFKERIMPTAILSDERHMISLAKARYNLLDVGVRVSSAECGKLLISGLEVNKLSPQLREAYSNYVKELGSAYHSGKDNPVPPLDKEKEEQLMQKILIYSSTPFTKEDFASLEMKNDTKYPEYICKFEYKMMGNLLKLTNTEIAYGYKSILRESAN